LYEIFGRIALTRKEERFGMFFKPSNLWLSTSVFYPVKGYVAAVLEDITERKSFAKDLWNAKRLGTHF
jgi:hypothetical protein